MMPATLLEANDLILRKECRPFDFDTDDPNVIFTLLKDTMIRYRGIGLAAPQIGDDRQVFVMGNPDQPETIIPVFNPRIVDLEGQPVLYEEGCLTFPGLFIKIKRPSQIRARYTNIEGEIDTIRFEGLTARIFQHEFDHLRGILYTTVGPRYRLDQAKQQKKRLDRRRTTNANQ